MEHIKQAAKAEYNKMERELSRLVRENGPPRTTDLSMMDAGAINVRENMGPRMTGIKSARSVYRSLGSNG